jgi:hypothetical protein
MSGLAQPEERLVALQNKQPTVKLRKGLLPGIVEPNIV